MISVFCRVENMVGKGEKACYLPFLLFPQCFNPKWQILDSSKLKEFADDNFKFDKNGRKFFKRIENTVGKGEIAFYVQFLLFSHRF